jgi:hypothetical protein
MLLGHLEASVRMQPEPLQTRESRCMRMYATLSQVYLAPVTLRASVIIGPVRNNRHEQLRPPSVARHKANLVRLQPLTIAQSVPSMERVT